MAEKKSFLLYLDDLDMLEELTMEERGQLLTAVYSYSAGMDLPEMSSAAKVAFIVIRKKLDRDGTKYAAQVAKNQANGGKGGRPKKKAEVEDEEETEPASEETQKNPEQTQENPTETQNNPEKPTGFLEGDFPGIENPTKPTGNPTITQKNMISDKCKVISDICTPLSGGNTRARTREDTAWIESLPMVLSPAQMLEVDGFLGRGMTRELIAWAVGEAASRRKSWEYARAILNDKFGHGIRRVEDLPAWTRPKLRKETSYDGEAFDRLGLELPSDAGALMG